MRTKRALTLVALVAVLGLSSVWYTNTVTKQASVLDEVNLSGSETSAETSATAPDQQSDSNTTQSGTSGTGVPAPTTPAATDTVEADFAAIEASIDGTYDDSSLNTTFTSEGASAMYNDYDF